MMALKHPRNAFLILCLAFTACGSKAPEGPGITTISVEVAQTKIAEGIAVLDIRTPAEYEAGALPGAVNINWFDATFAKDVQAQFAKDKAVLIHCKSGGRSSKAVTMMAELGYTEMYHLSSGWDGWVEAGANR